MCGKLRTALRYYRQSPYSGTPYRRQDRNALPINSMPEVTLMALPSPSPYTDTTASAATSPVAITVSIAACTCAIDGPFGSRVPWFGTSDASRISESICRYSRSQIPHAGDVQRAKWLAGHEAYLRYMCRGLYHCVFDTPPIRAARILYPYASLGSA